MRFPFLVVALLTVPLIFFGCAKQEDKLGPCPDGLESHGPIYDRGTILFHYESFDHDAIAAIPPMPEGINGGEFTRLWKLAGTIEDFDAAGIAKVRVDKTESDGYLLDEAYLDANDATFAGKALSIGDRIECRFLYDSSSEVITLSPYNPIQILDAE